jgi:transposase
MPSFRASELLPTGFCAVGASSEGEGAVVTIRAMSANSSCPSCGAVSNRVHSQYPRRLADLPIAGRRAVLMLQARRFRCEAVLCERRIFTERFNDNILKPWARRTARLDQIVHCLAIALGGRPAASFARRLSIPVSNDTLLRAVRRRGNPSFAPAVIVGIDDWAWRRNHRYGTLICDLERRKTIALLPDRELTTAEAWLSGQPQIAVVARDRGGGYALAAQRALPDAVQVADRWHLMENASHAFLGAVRKSMREIRTVIGAATINPDLLTAAEKLQYEGYLRREETNATILAMAKEGATIKEIVRSAGYSRGLVRKVLRGQRSDVFRVRSGSLEVYLPWLDEQWAAGRRNGSELWRSLKQRGFRGCLRVVSEWSGRRRRSRWMQAR